MNIFITGQAGFLGSHLADRLHDDGHRISGCDNFIGGEHENLLRGGECWNADCTNWEDMDRIMTFRRPDVVYHCAATAYEGLSVFSPSFVTRNIYEASVAVFSAAIRAGVKRIVFCSSMARYGKQDYPFRETMTPLPVDPYGIAKVAAEQTLKVLCEQHGVEYVIAVPHNIYGPRQKYDDPYRNVASIFINRILQGKQPIIYGNGGQMRCFSYIDDVLDCFVKLMDVPSGTVVNVGPDEEFVTIEELARQCATACDVANIDPIFVDDRPCEVKYATCSARKARVLLGYETKVNLEEGLGYLVEDIKRRGPKEFDYAFPLEIRDGAPRTWSEKLI
jgi:UDP-glucose 4-epimerase